MQTIGVRHNIEVAHRLFTTPGKCENIHGHSMWVTLTLHGEVGHTGMVAGLDFGDIKKEFRTYLDTNYDHRILLNAADPFAGGLFRSDSAGRPSGSRGTLPGLNATEGDPTTENIARWVGERMRSTFNLMETGIQRVEVEVWETHVNKANWASEW